MLKKTLIVDDYEKILEYILTKSEIMYKKIKEDSKSDYILIIKNITHSDIITSGKRTGKEQSIEKNYLYYLSIDQMIELEKQTNSKFETAKQSNIFLPEIFYEFLGIKQLERRKGRQENQHEHILINEYADVFLVNETLKYFNEEYTNKVFEKLKKNIQDKYFKNFKLEISDNDYTSIELRHAIHGIGTSKDELFNNLRKTIFKNDTLILLMKSNEIKKEVYILLDKNPIFYTIVEEKNKNWEKYILNENKKMEYNLGLKEKIMENDNEKTRNSQNKWRILLAEEMMNYTPNDNYIFCPLTYINVNFKNLGSLFRASHIKAYADCSIEEAFDINNGIIMIANADALFDKHLITIDDKGKIIFSYLLDQDHLLKQQLRLTENVFEAILNQKRLKYLEYHREIFYKEEEKRKSKFFMDEDSIY